MKLWAGRTGGDVDDRLSAINNSIGFDSRMYRQDITGSIAHAKMLGRQGIISEEDAAAIAEGLKGILSDIESGALQIDRVWMCLYLRPQSTPDPRDYLLLMLLVLAG